MSRQHEGQQRVVVNVGVAGKTSGGAIASLVCSLLGLVTCGLSAIVGVILGIVALRRIHRSQGMLRGRGLAIAGIVLGCVLFVMGAILGAIPASVIFRNEINNWTVEMWQRARGEADEEPGDFFGENQNRSPVPGIHRSGFSTPHWPSLSSAARGCARGMMLGR
jgi:hypothetical protein